MEGEVTFQPNEADYVAAHRDHLLCSIWSRRGLSRMATAALVLAVALAAIGFLGGDTLSAIIVAFAGGLVFGAFLVLLSWGLSYLLLPRRARRLFRQHRALQEEVSCGWSDAGLSYRSVNGSGRIAWGDLHRRAEGKHTFLFYLTENLFHFVPRRAVSDSEAEDLRNTAAGLSPPPP